MGRREVRRGGRHGLGDSDAMTQGGADRIGPCAQRTVVGQFVLERCPEGVTGPQSSTECVAPHRHGRRWYR